MRGSSLNSSPRFGVSKSSSITKPVLVPILAMRSSRFIPAVNSAEVETEQCCKALSKGANGNADIADIALQQLMEVQDS